MSFDPPRSTPPWVWFLLAGLLVWSLGLRVWFASSGLNGQRFWDEHYNVKNVRSILETGRLRPVSFYYPSLSYLPHTALLATAENLVHWTKGDDYSFFDGPRFKPEGYLLSRLLQVVFAGLTLIFTFLIGRRLFSPQVGLLAALLVAVTPIHIRLSTIFKPDILLLLTTLLAFWWSLKAAARPTLGRYVLAGFGVGLALASKMNGGPVAIPLTLAALVLGFRDRRQWGWLAVAGAVAALVFVLFNPQVDLHLRGLQRNLDLYEMQGAAGGERAGGGMWGVLFLAATFLLSPSAHGGAVGTLGLAGLLVLIATALRQRPPRRALPLAMLLSFPLGYSILYAATTSYAKPNNFLQVIPFTALAAAFLLVAGWDQVRSRLGPLLVTLPAGTGGGLALLLALYLLYSAQAFAYTVLTPTTWQRALGWVTAQLRPWDGRVVYFEEPAVGRASLPEPQRTLVRQVPRLSGITHLWQGDASVFLKSRLEEVDGDFYARRVAAVEPDRVHVFAGEWFKARGADVVVLLHPLERVSSRQGRVSAGGLDGRRYDLALAGPSPEAGPRLLSLEVSLPRAPGAGQPRLQVGESVLQLFGKAQGKKRLMMSERFAWDPAVDPPAATLELPVALGPGGAPTVTVHRWRGESLDGPHRP